MSSPDSFPLRLLNQLLRPGATFRPRLGWLQTIGALLGAAVSFSLATLIATAVCLFAIPIGSAPAPAVAFLIIGLLLHNALAIPAGVIHAACILAWGGRAMPDRVALVWLLAVCLAAGLCNRFGARPNQEWRATNGAPPASASA